MTRPRFLATALMISCIMLVSGKGFSAEPDLHSLPPDDVLEKLDLSRSGLEAVRSKLEAGDRQGALEELLNSYRNRYPLPESAADGTKHEFPVADQLCEHIFQWGPYEAADYGDEIDWGWDPRGDIEWVAAVYRFFWAPTLAKAYRHTRNEKYVRAFVELTSDWIAKHPLEKRHKTHPVYTRWRGFAWLDIQTGIRADNLCKAFPMLVHGEAFTPHFLSVFLASVYDHQVKTERIPMGRIHNKAIFEQRGFAHVASTFPEFRDADRWMALAVERTCKNFLAQTTEDGVQREWSFGYNLAVLRDAVDIMGWADSMEVTVPGEYRERVRAMYDYIFAIATPGLAGPMFGDASRSVDTSRSRRHWPLYDTLREATELLGDPKYAARAKLRPSTLPPETSYAFPAAGMYVMRDRWGPDQVYLALHCSPRGISGHDQPDNGTFELCAYGRWLMPDSGFYTYGHDREGRAWHRQTRVHQTLTLDGEDSQIAGRHLLWQSDPEADVLVVENRSYQRLTHRRSVWFVDKKFFVILDEAMGDAPGTLRLHFQLAPGDARINTQEHWASTAFDDANVLIWADPEAPVVMQEEEGWWGRKYGHRERRPAFCYRHTQSAPAAFLTLVVPTEMAKQPQVSATLPPGFRVGASRVSLTVSALGKAWQLGRDLADATAWCRAGD